MGLAVHNPKLHEASLKRVDRQLDNFVGRFVLSAYDKQVGNVPLAAFLTFIINLTVGSFLTITLPSLIVPFSGLALMVARAVEWGLIFAPVKGKDVILPHLFTLAIEGQPYVLASLGSWIHGRHLVRQLLQIRAKRNQGDKSSDTVTNPSNQKPDSATRPLESTPTKFNYFAGLQPTIRLYPSIALMLFVSAIWEAYEVIHLVPESATIAKSVAEL